jgi:Cdc6-like AAA superfamily ATPase
VSSGSSLTPMPEFRPAVKESRPVRLAFEGPSGSGRTLTSLLVAAALRGPLPLIDTEPGLGAN